MKSHAEVLGHVLKVAKDAGYAVDAVEIGTDLKVRLRPASPPEPQVTAYPPPPRQPEESNDAYEAREREAKQRSTRDAAIRRLAKEIGTRAAAEHVDRAMAAGMEP